MRAMPYSPDCAQGKHKACLGDAWDFDADVRAACACGCHGAATSGPPTLRVVVPPTLWLTSNRPITNHAYKARLVRALHGLAKDAAEEQSLAPVTGRVHAVWRIAYPKGTGWKHGDAANGHPTCKALLDGLVAAGVLDGDGPRHVRPETYDRSENHTERGDHVVVLELHPEGGDAP